MNPNQAFAKWIVREIRATLAMCTIIAKHGATTPMSSIARDASEVADEMDKLSPDFPLEGKS